MTLNTSLTGFIVGFAMCLLSVAQDSTAFPSDATSPKNPDAPIAHSQPEQPSTVPRIAPGSVIPVRLSKTVDAKKAKDGDEVDALVTQDLKSVSGEVVVSKDTKVVGHVTEAQARSKEQKESQVGIAFDHAVMKDGSVAALPMSIQAVIVQTNQPSENMNSGAEAPPSAGPSQPNRAGRPGEMGSGTPQDMPGVDSAGGQPSPDSTRRNGNQSVSANTQGVVGISDYKLSTTGDETHGSVVSSEKNNVKLEGGTLMLLRVNQ